MVHLLSPGDCCCGVVDPCPMSDVPLWSEIVNAERSNELNLDDLRAGTGSRDLIDPSLSEVEFRVDLSRNPTITISRLVSIGATAESIANDGVTNTGAPITSLFSATSSASVNLFIRSPNNIGVTTVIGRDRRFVTARWVQATPFSNDPFMITNVPLSPDTDTLGETVSFTNFNGSTATMTSGNPAQSQTIDITDCHVFRLSLGGATGGTVGLTSTGLPPDPGTQGTLSGFVQISASAAVVYN